MSKEKSEFAARMKSYESIEILSRTLPLCARLDGRSFSKFTKNFERPFDYDMSKIMLQTTQDLMKEFNVDVGYTQSDEISLFWKAVDEESLTELPFGGKIQKLNSILASYCTLKFNQHLLNSPLLEQSGKDAHFDARVFNVPTAVEQANTFLWRYRDCHRNAFQSVCQHLLGPKKCKGLKLIDQIAYVEEESNFEILDWVKHGQIIQKHDDEILSEKMNFQKCMELLKNDKTLA